MELASCPRPGTLHHTRSLHDARADQQEQGQEGQRAARHAFVERRESVGASCRRGFCGPCTLQPSFGGICCPRVGWKAGRCLSTVGVYLVARGNASWMTRGRHLLPRPARACDKLAAPALDCTRKARRAAAAAAAAGSRRGTRRPVARCGNKQPRPSNRSNPPLDRRHRRRAANRAGANGARSTEVLRPSTTNSATARPVAGALRIPAAAGDRDRGLAQEGGGVGPVGCGGTVGAALVCCSGPSRA